MASLPYPRTLLQQCSPTDFTLRGCTCLKCTNINPPTDFTDLHGWLGCVVDSHRFHRIHRSLLLKRNSHRFHGFAQMVRLRSGLPQNSQNTQKFIAEKELPQRTLRGCTCLKCTNQ